MGAAVLRLAPRAAKPVSDGTRVPGWMAEREALVRQIAALDVRIAAECRAYSDAHGFRMTLRPEQVCRDITARAVAKLRPRP